MTRKVISLFLIVSIQLFAKQYDNTIIDIEAKLFPKIALLEEHIEKDNSKYLNIFIISQNLDMDVANEFKSAIESNYTKILLNKKIIVKTAEFKELDSNKPDVIIVLHHSDEELKKIALWANENKILSFVYDPSCLKFGFTASIYIGKTTKPYLNSAIIKKYKFLFNSYLLQLSKFKQ